MYKSKPKILLQLNLHKKNVNCTSILLAEQSTKLNKILCKNSVSDISLS